MIQISTSPFSTRKAGFGLRGNRFRSSTAIALLAAVGVAGVASAQEWTGAVNTDYGTAGNWNPAAVPTVGDDVLVDTFSDVDVAGGAFAADTLQQDSGTMTVTGTGSLDVTTGAGTVLFRHQGALQVDAGGSLTANTFTADKSATVSVDGTLDADTEIAGTAELDVNAGGLLDGNLMMTGVDPSVDIAAGGTLSGDATVNRGTLSNDGSIGGGISTTGGNATVSVNVGASGTVAGMVDHDAGTLTNAGSLNGGLSVGNGATANVSPTGSVAGGTTVGLGTLNIAAGGTTDGVTLNGGQNGGVVNNSGTINGGVTANGGEFNTDGTINGNVLQTGGGIFNAEGSIVGDITVNTGDFVTTGALAHTGNFANNHRLNVSGGNLTTTGSFTNTGDLAIDDGRTVSFAGGLNNSGRVGLGAGSPGSIVATVGGPLVGAAGSNIDMKNGVAGDGITVQGGVSGVNTLSVDVDLRTTNAGFSDVLTVNGTLDGDLTVDVDSIRLNGVYTLQQNDILLVDATGLGGALNTSLSGDLPQNRGLVLYSLLEDNANSDVLLQSELNPALGGVAAAFSSVQSLVNTTVNRPSGAYVSGIAFDAPGNCSTGSWARGTGGRAVNDSMTSNSMGTSVSSSGSLDYSGIQGGIDFGCFEAFNGGWDVSAGLLVGFNSGDFHENAGGLTTRGDFDQHSFGAYVAASSGNWSGELQVRHGESDFTFNNPVLGLRNSDVAAESNSISGSMTYRHDLQDGMALLPSFGFDVTRSSAGSLWFENGQGAALGKLDVEDHTSQMGFLGTTLSKTMVDEAANSATNSFVTATYYVDGSGSRSSTFTTTNGVGVASLSTSEVGNFGEVSVGASHVRVLSNSPGSIRQVNFGVRADYRFSSDVEALGVSGQVRLQF